MRAPTLALAVVAAALIAAAHQPADAQHEKQPFCLQSPRGSLNCTYDSLEQCQQILGGHAASGTCVANPAWSDTTSESVRSPPRKIRP
ncbi:MAG TPA: DUF3551 domain-containing protein [Xanthobacteraceae bacterium]